MIDPNLIAAREIVKATLKPDSHQRCNCRAEIDAGGWDGGQTVRATLAGIKRGRELAASCQCAVCRSDLRGITPCLNEEF
ncbi:hypothetical protein [Novosphingobium resinovorum]|uniref:hypothetical protein n=1 Tax=Novosphingobium resinovorum TaxID=158500 RepID=UPI002ED20C10|nr:hypothetical protein [Novosphingobium resinovorum]